MKTIKTIIYVILSGVVLYLSWLVFYILTPFIMNLSWIWMIVLFFILGGFIIPLIGFLPGLLSIVIGGLRSYSTLEKILVGILVILFAFSAGRLSWTFALDYGFKQIVFALLQNLLVIGVFWGMFLSLALPIRDK